jgi:hypothetical protein
VGKEGQDNRRRPVFPGRLNHFFEKGTMAAMHPIEGPDGKVGSVQGGFIDGVNALHGIL